MGIILISPKTLGLFCHHDHCLNIVILFVSGWQYQQSPPTIQCIVEKALTRVTKLEREDLYLVGASRTDTGVHAWGQV